jgi:hypothetical protein
VLRGISAVYDPLGFISPLTIPARILIQDIWKLKLDWDDALPQDLIEKWIDISKTIENTTVSFRRPYLAKGKALELHVFVDASQAAYGAVVFLVTVIHPLSFFQNPASHLSEPTRKC